MEYFLVKDGKVLWLSEDEFKALDPGITVQKAIKDMTHDQSEAFNEERYEKFLKPLYNHNIQELNKQISKKEERREIIARRKSWRIDPETRKKK